MPLAPGQTLSFYEILGPLGAGGMGEVWRARDTRLEREVALKVLPDELADDDERLRRFEREAKTLAALNHPNVAHLYGIDQVGDVCFIVMELVSGEDLATRLARGRMPLAEALDVCRQIAEGLEAAHEAGVVHRDLKPANVRLTPEGVVKLLDFGLAKPIGPRARSGSGTTSAQADSFLVTEEGLVLGTPTYMSPEQARGKPVDRRTDIWAFGCVLYECLTGGRAFGGDSLTDLLAAIVEHEPDWNALAPETPAAVRGLLQRCLTKDPRQRLRDVGEARVLLETGGVAAGLETPAGQRTGSATRIAAAALLVLAVGVPVGYFLGRSRGTPEGGMPLQTRSLLAAPEGTTFQMTGDFGGPPVLSPDGTKLAFIGNSRDGESRVWIRMLDDLEARAVPGTEGAYQPFWSPDGRSIGFFAEDALRRVDLDGSSPLRLASVAQGKGGAWGADGTILFSPNHRAPLYFVPSAGGEARQVTELEPDQTTHRWPCFLPDGKRFLYFAADHRDLEHGRKGIFVASLAHGTDQNGKMTRTVEGAGQMLVEGDANGVFSAGHLFYVAGGALLARPYDPESGAWTGEPHLLGEEARVETSTWRMNLDASSSGNLVYQPRQDAANARLRWVDRTGAEVGSLATQGVTLTINLSPSGRFLAVQSQVLPTSDIWVHDLERGLRTKLTLEASSESYPVWSPDETRIVFQSNRLEGKEGLFEKLASGASRVRKVYETERRIGIGEVIFPDDWSPDGRWLLMVQASDYGTAGRLCILSLQDEDASPLALVASEAAVHGQFSPDGRWLAYSAVEGGNEEVYVVPFDSSELEGTGSEPLFADAPRWQISRAGGSRPRWRGDGKEIYYVRRDNTVVAVPLEVEGGSLHIGEASDLFTAPIRFRDYSYDVAQDGQRFILSTQGSGDATPLVLVSDWRAELAAH